MKRTFLTIAALACAFSFSHAQMKPTAGSFGLGFNLTGLANVSFNNWTGTGLGGQEIVDPLGYIPAGTTVGDLVPQQMLFGRYYLADDLALRVSLGINSTSASTETVDSVAGSNGQVIQNFDSKFSAFSFGIGAGIEKHFATEAARIDPYAGAQINFAILGAPSYEENTETLDDPLFNQSTMVDWSGGTAFSIDLIAGFNYFFSDNFAIGAEMSWGFGTVSIGGEYTEVIDTRVGSTTNTSEVKGTFSNAMSGFRVGSTAGVNASIFF